MDPYPLIASLAAEYPEAGRILTIHGELVAAKALSVADRLRDYEIDREFLFQAAVLHDIGMIGTDLPGLGCYGEEPYIRHGIIGRRMLEEAGYPRHALVCERHFLTGVSREIIERQGMDLPLRDMLPITLEERLICFADCFYSKKLDRLKREKSVEKTMQGLPEFARPQFREWLAEFREPKVPSV